MMISMGYFTETPDFHLIFIHTFIGYLIAFLEKTWPMINWYSFSLIALLILSFSVINYIFWKRKGILTVNKYGIHIIFVALFIFVVINIQFTVIGGIVAAAGLISILWSRDKSWMVFGVLLFTIGVMVRFHSGLLVLLLALPFFVYQFKMKSVLMCSLLFTVVGINYWADHLVYAQDTEWAEYRSLNQVRGSLHDNQRFFELYENEEITNQIQSFDLKLFYYFFPDPQIFDLQTLSKMKNAIKGINLKGLLKLYYVTPHILFFGFVMAYLCIIEIEERKIKYFLLASFGIMIFGYLYISLEGRVKERVVWTSIIPIFTFSIFSFQKTLKKSKKITPLLAIIFLLIVYKSFHQNKINKQIIEQNLPKLEKLEFYNEESFIMYPFFMQINSFRILENTPTITKYKIHYHGWLLGIPFNKFVVPNFSEDFLKNKYLLIMNYDQNIVRIQSSFSKYGELRLVEENEVMQRIEYGTPKNIGSVSDFCK